MSVDLSKDFSIHNIPFGIFSTGDGKKVGVAYHDNVISLDGLVQHGILDLPSSAVNNEYLNDFISLGKSVTSEVRTKIQELLKDDGSSIYAAKEAWHKMSDVVMHMPVKVGDYTDFYSSIEHATNVGIMFRGKENALMPNWKHLPVGYHGRASSIIESGVDIRRPSGQTMPVGAEAPVYGPSKRMDFELETAFIIGKGNNLGEAVPTSQAEDYIFGMVLFNDWSARDIQKWEYVPLGPFLGKSFASSVSPWVVTLEALDPFRVAGPDQDPEVLPYLKYEGDHNYDVHLDVFIQPENGEETLVSKSNFKYMYWNMLQQVAHHTVNGCNIRVGDMMASGTISGKDENSYGSLLEITWGGKKTIEMNGGVERKFLEDKDSVIIRGYCEKDGMRVGFGEVRSKVLPAL